MTKFKNGQCYSWFSWTHDSNFSDIYPFVNVKIIDSDVWTEYGSAMKCLIVKIFNEDGDYCEISSNTLEYSELDSLLSYYEGSCISEDKFNEIFCDAMGTLCGYFGKNNKQESHAQEVQDK